MALVIVAGLLSFGVLSASALGITLVTGPTDELGGRMWPTTLPRATPRPITIAVEGTLPDSEAGTGPPALKALSLQFDRDGSIFTKGLPTCKWSPISEFSIAQACRKALVGHGEIVVHIHSPEQALLFAQGKLQIFNGPARNGRPVLIYYVYAHVPAATTYMTSGVVEKSQGKYGTQTTIHIPTFVSGYGSLTSFQAKIGKTWRYNGKKVSLFTAHCRRGGLVVHDEFELVDGSKQEGDPTQPCAPAGRSRSAR